MKLSISSRVVSVAIVVLIAFNSIRISSSSFLRPEIFLFLPPVQSLVLTPDIGTTTHRVLVRRPFLLPIMRSATTTLPLSSSSSNDTIMTHEERMQRYLKETNRMELPPAPRAAANYLPCQRSGDLLFLSGHLPLSRYNENDTTTTTTTLEPYTGRLTAPHHNDSSVEEQQQEDPVAIGYAAAQQAGWNIIATIRHELGGSINDVDQVIKLFGLVQSSDNFHQQHLVMNGCSDLMTAVFGPVSGPHARSAVGTNALPLNAMIEIEAIVRIKPQPSSSSSST